MSIRFFRDESIVFLNLKNGGRLYRKEESWPSGDKRFKIHVLFVVVILYSNVNYLLQKNDCPVIVNSKFACEIQNNILI